MKVIVGNSWRTIEMKKRFNEYSLLADKNLKQAEKKSFRDLYPNRPAVKLEISDEGMESMRKRAQALGGRVEVEDFTPAILSYDYSHLFGHRLSTCTDEESHTFQEEAANLVRTYAELYDEIVREHENGQREIYVETPGGEERARRITLSEELACLDEAFEKYSDRLTSRMASPFAMVSIPGKPARLLLNFSESSPSREQWRKLETDVIREYGQEAEQAIEGARQTYIKNKAAAEDVSEKMRAAVQEFIAQYVRGNRMGISEILDFLK